MSFRSRAQDEVMANERRPGRASDVAFHIEPGSDPIAMFVLAPDQGLVWNTGSILIADAGLKIGRWPGRGREMALVVNATKAAARLEAGSRHGGPLGAFDLKRHGRQLLFARRALAGAGPGVAMTRYGRLTGSAAAAGEAGFPLLWAKGEGWLFLTAVGRVIERRLVPGERVTAAMGNLVAMTSTIDADDTTGEMAASFVQLTGPGTIWVQAGRAGAVDPVHPEAARAVRPSGPPVLDVVR